MPLSKSQEKLINSVASKLQNIGDRLDNRHQKNTWSHYFDFNSSRSVTGRTGVNSSQPTAHMRRSIGTQAGGNRSRKTSLSSTATYSCKK